MKELYNQLLKDAKSDGDTAFIYHQHARVRKQRGEYAESASFLQKSLIIQLKIVPEDDFSLDSTRRNFGEVYNSIGDYSKTLET